MKLSDNSVENQVCYRKLCPPQILSDKVYTDCFKKVYTTAPSLGMHEKHSNLLPQTVGRHML